MAHARIFSDFTPVSVRADGASIYDFLGVGTAAKFRKGWDAHCVAAGREVTPRLPPPNEHYFDWVLLLESVVRAKGAFRMGELGAGWGAWIVRGAAAARQRPSIGKVELFAVEADKTHYEWMLHHMEANGLDPAEHHLLHGAVAASSGTVKFPVVADPAENYGASTRAVTAGTPFVVVEAYTIADILDRCSGPLDFLHIDMQGAEYETIPKSIDLLSGKVKRIMIGTHISDELHNALAESFAQAGWTERMNFQRASTADSELGPIKLGDGLIAVDNPRAEDL
ncbi:FkbM family methyltransferase [Hansschlegelia zhihuaiae]|uniref:FkbM family methyltransferase n=1 Tax=Hansschlegelia zhihuaiae TaxID=405005 RepID=UPI0013E8D642|nr:FkbM family methyltransferase [Hansschlegelia zhihuaiae]